MAVAPASPRSEFPACLGCAYTRQERLYGRDVRASSVQSKLHLDANSVLWARSGPNLSARASCGLTSWSSFAATVKLANVLGPWRVAFAS